MSLKKRVALMTSDTQSIVSWKDAKNIVVLDSALPAILNTLKS